MGTRSRGIPDVGSISATTTPTPGATTCFVEMQPGAACATVRQGTRTRAATSATPDSALEGEISKGRRRTTIQGVTAMRSFWVSGTLSLILMANGLLADEGRIPIFQPATIAQPGDYVLTRDLTLTPGQVITIHSDNVILDLNGHTLTGASSGYLVKIDDGFKDIVIRNGRLTGSGGEVGVYYLSTTNRTRIQLDGLEIANVDTGILIKDAEYVEVRSCKIRDFVQNGVLVLGFSDTFGGRFLRNTITGLTNAMSNVVVTGLNLHALRGGEIRENIVTGPGTSASIGISISRIPDFGAPALAS